MQAQRFFGSAYLPDGFCGGLAAAGLAFEGNKVFAYFECGRVFLGIASSPYEVAALADGRGKGMFGNLRAIRIFNRG